MSIFGSNPPAPDAGQGQQALPQGQETQQVQPQDTGGRQRIDLHEDNLVPQVEEGTPEGERIAGKFNSVNDLAKSADQLAGKLGKEIDWEKVQTQEQLEELYRGMEKQLGRTSDIDRTRHENTTLKEENDMLKSYVNQLSNYLQYAQQTQAQAQQVQTQIQPQHSEPPLDKDKFISDFYDKGPEAITSLIQAELRKQQSQQVQAQPQTQQAQPHMTPQNLQIQYQWMQNYNRQVTQLVEEYGADYERYKGQAQQFLTQNPLYARMPNGLKYAFDAARRDAQRAERLQGQRLGQEVQNNYFKQAAQLPGSAVRTPQGQNKTKDQMIIDHIFGSQGNSRLWG